MLHYCNSVFTELTKVLELCYITSDWPGPHTDSCRNTEEFGVTQQEVNIRSSWERVCVIAASGPCACDGSASFRSSPYPDF